MQKYLFIIFILIFKNNCRDEGVRLLIHLIKILNLMYTSTSTRRWLKLNFSYVNTTNINYCPFSDKKSQYCKYMIWLDLNKTKLMPLYNTRGAWTLEPWQCRSINNIVSKSVQTLSTALWKRSFLISSKEFFLFIPVE